MKYAHILSYVASTPWAMLQDKMDEFLAVLAFRAAGHVFSADEIKARIGDPQPPNPTKRGNVAVIPLRGVIAHRMGAMDEASGGMSAERFKLMFRAAAADESIGTIVIDADSPGGTIPGVPEAADEVFGARDKKHIVAVANGRMASAAYWIASQAHEIVAIPSLYDPSVGSIGVFTVHQDLSEHLAKEGIKMTLISAGKHKAQNNPFTPLSDEVKADLQAMVDSAYTGFVKAVARGRGVSVADVRSGFGEGKALPATEAKAAGLVDRIATMEDTIGRLIGKSSRAEMRAEAEPDPMALLSEEQRAAMVADTEVIAVARRRRLERF
jgi:signal peptide peptidase SppA